MDGTMPHQLQTAKINPTIGQRYVSLMSKYRHGHGDTISEVCRHQCLLYLFTQTVIALH